MSPFRTGLSSLRVALAVALAVALGAGCSSSTNSSRTCAEIECGEYGKCSGELDGGPACVCDEGYTGEDCSECDDGYVREGDECVPAESSTGCDGDPCGGNGECDDSSGEVTCECDEGYTGDDCSECDTGYHEEDGACVEDQECGPNSCPPNATCEDDEGIISCVCNEGFRGDDCDECNAGFHIEDGECVEDVECMPSTCAGAGECSADTGTPVCVCDEGYTGENCDECAAGYHEEEGQCLIDEECGPDSCPPNSTCDDSDGSVVCTCDEGYTGEDCDECVEPLVMNEAGECVELECEEGYELGETGVCEPMECDEGFQLINLAEVDVSELPPELFPDGVPDSGYICLPTDTDLTCEDADPCGPYGTCDDSSGTLVCICDEGYTGLQCTECAAGYHPDGAQCVPDETCLESTCNSRGTCDDSTGEIDCTCDEGYAGSNCDECGEDFFTAPDGSCVPYEICDVSTCNGSGACAVVQGVTQCTCFLGYTGEFCDECAGGYHDEGGVCVIDDTCGPNSCSECGTCDDSSGVVVCTCNPECSGSSCQECGENFTRQNGVCVLIDNGNDCEETTCNGNGECDDTSGQAVCDCEPPAAGVACQSCIPGYVKYPDGVCRISTCGDGIYDPTSEECDDGTLVQEDCTYGLMSCQVCGGTSPAMERAVLGPDVRGQVLPPEEPSPYPSANYCQLVPGYTNFCGDGILDYPENVFGSAETCDVGFEFNQDAAYGGCADNCTFNPYCGDTDLQAAEEEECDDGPGADCEYYVFLDDNEVISTFYGACEVGNTDSCLNSCVENVCGDNFVNEDVEDEGFEECDDGDVPDDCPDGEECDAANRDECTTECTLNTCGDGYVYQDPYACCEGYPYFFCSPDNCVVLQKVPSFTPITAGAEPEPPDYEGCDWGDENAASADPDCAYGLTNCSLCGNECEPVEGNPNYCGDGNTDSIDGEDCDLGPTGNLPDYECPYTETQPLENCTFCNTGCDTAFGNAHYCGDGVQDADDGEGCDWGPGNQAAGSDCEYGLMNCTFCTTGCDMGDGTPNFCGDGNIDFDDYGEVCDTAATPSGCMDDFYCVSGCKTCAPIVSLE